MARPGSLSVLMPIFQGVRFLDRVLGALAEQRLDVPWDFLAVDCGSTDGTLEVFERRARDFPVPLRVHSIEGAEFNHGDTRNLLAALSSGELLFFVTDDAIAAGADLLARAVENFADPDVAAVCCRNVPRPEADPLVRIFSENDPSYATERRVARIADAGAYRRTGAEARRRLYNYSDTASCMRRSLWERHPYPRCAFGEDALQARAFLEAGYAVVFDDRARVQHSHEYGPEETRRRAADDAAFNAMWLGYPCVASEADAEAQARAQLERDRRGLAALGFSGARLEAELERALELRRAHYLGLHDGSLAARRYPPTELLPRAEVAVLLVAPEGASSAAAGRELARRGHRVERADPGQPADALLERARRIGAVALHAVGAGPGTAELLARAAERGLRSALELEEGAAGDDLAAVAAACRPADLVLCPRVERKRALLAADVGDVLKLAVSPSPGDGSSGTRRKTAEERALELEFRWRELACRRPEWAPRVLLERAGAAGGGADSAGGGERQDASIALLRSDRAGRLEYDVAGAGGGERELVLRLVARADDGPAIFGGRALLDGAPLGPIGPLAAAGHDEPREVRLRAVWPPGARCVTVENELDGERYTLRLEALQVRDPRAARRRCEPGELLLDRAGRRADRVEGDARSQGADALLLGPGPAAVEVDLGGLPPVPCELAVHVPLVGAEGGLEVGGRLLVDGVPLARFGSWFAAGSDELRVVRVLLASGAAARTLRLENSKRDGRRPLGLRVQRIVVRAAPRGPGVAERALRRLRAALDLPARLDGAEPAP